MSNAYGPYSPIKQVGQFYYISGQVGIDNKTKHAKTAIDDQTHQVFKNLHAVLDHAGLQFNDIVKTTVYLKNIDDFAAVNDIYMTYFEDSRPARTCIAVANLPRVAGDTELLIEIDAIAFKKDKT